MRKGEKRKLGARRTILMHNTLITSRNNKSTDRSTTALHSRRIPSDCNGFIFFFFLRSAVVRVGRDINTSPPQTHVGRRCVCACVLTAPFPSPYAPFPVRSYNVITPVVVRRDNDDRIIISIRVFPPFLRYFVDDRKKKYSQSRMF